MAGEPILIVDDTPINLKLTRILLANEGYKVQTAASAEEALEMLRGYHPRLILADIQLPGMDGLEMTRRVKSDQQTRDITVVALTAYAMKGDEERAREAGCDGYITKPIDTRTLGLRIREYLDRSAPPTAETPSVAGALGGDLAGTDMNTLRRRFLSEGEEVVRRLLADLDGAFHAPDAAKVVHQWVGAGSLLGYNAIGRISRELVGLLAERPIDAAEVRQSLTNLAFAFSCQREALELPVPQPLIDALAGKCVAIVGLPVNDAQRLAATLDRATARPLISSVLPIDPSVPPCDVVVLKTGIPGAYTGGLPTVFVGRREDLFSLDVSRQLLFLHNAWHAEEALVRISLAVARPLPTPGPPLPVPSSVLVAADDASLVALVGKALENAGIACGAVPDGNAALENLRHGTVGALVLDAGIRGLDYSQVLSTLRSETLGVRVFLLASRHQASEILHGVALGAGDFLFKPFSPLELVARLKRLMH